MIIQTPALVLAIRPWSKTSHMVTWLTPEHGKIVTAVKGACRPKSAFLGQYDLFYTCDLLFYRRDSEGVHAIRECAPLALREGLRHQWRRAAAASYLCDLVARVTGGHQDARPVFGLLGQTLDRLSAAAPLNVHELILWFEMQLLQHAGLMPDLTPCPECHPPGRSWLRFSLPSGRFLCPHLAQHQTGEATLSLHRDVLELFAALSQRPHEVLPPTGQPSFASKKSEDGANLLLGLSRFLGMFIAFHLDVPSAVRRVALEMIDTTLRQKPVLLENS